MKNLGIDVYFEKENIHTINSEGEVLLTLISAVSQSESLSLSDNVKWGKRRKYENGVVRSISLGKFYGYETIDGELVIKEDEAAVVRRIYTDFLDGYSFSQIAARLTAEGVPTDQGGASWNMSSLRKILTNEKAKGDMLFQKTYSIDYLEQKRAKNNGELPQYYIENSHPALVSKMIWECVRLELVRQDDYCREHHICKHHCSSEEHPLSARIICATCGCTYMLLRSKRVGDEGRPYWRCSSFRGERSHNIEGRTYAPLPTALWTKYPDSGHARYRAKHRKVPAERQMLCSDIQIPEDAPEKAFVKAWNLIVCHRLRYVASFDRIAKESEDLLIQHRAKEMIQLVNARLKLYEFDYALSLKTLDHIEVTPDGKLVVLFLSGAKITIS